MLELDSNVLPSKARVMLSGIGDDVIFCKDLEDAGYGCVTGVGACHVMPICVSGEKANAHGSPSTCRQTFRSWRSTDFAA
jgi:hypothetical protein